MTRARVLHIKSSLEGLPCDGRALETKGCRGCVGKRIATQVLSIVEEGAKGSSSPQTSPSFQISRNATRMISSCGMLIPTSATSGAGPRAQTT